jgi:hypothetical protein
MNPCTERYNHDYMLLIPNKTHPSSTLNLSHRLCCTMITTAFEEIHNKEGIDYVHSVEPTLAIYLPVKINVVRASQLL